jgi:DNA-binding XRE family transcriptional regulator
MNHDLLHIQGKPYMLVPLHEYRQLTNSGNDAGSNIPADILDRLHARTDHPVKIIRKYRAMTQHDLAAASGLSRPYLAEIETGRKDGSVSAIKALAAALQIPAGLLL